MITGGQHIQGGATGGATGDAGGGRRGGSASSANLESPQGGLFKLRQAA